MKSVLVYVSNATKPSAVNSCESEVHRVNARFCLWSRPPLQRRQLSVPGSLDSRHRKFLDLEASGCSEEELTSASGFFSFLRQNEEPLVGYIGRLVRTEEPWHTGVQIAAWFLFPSSC